MDSSKYENRKKKSFTPLGILFALAGLALFAYFVKKAGVAQIADGIRRLGAGFVLIIAISAIRHIVRSFAWMLCMEPPYRLRFRRSQHALNCGTRGLRFVRDNCHFPADQRVQQRGFPGIRPPDERNEPRPEFTVHWRGRHSELFGTY